MSRRRVPDEVGIAGILVLVVVVMSLLSPNFRTAGNFEVLLLNGAVVALLALGQTFVLLTGGIDLSTGSNLALTGMAAALGMQAGLPGGQPRSSRWPSASRWASSTGSSCTTCACPRSSRRSRCSASPAASP